MLRCRISPLKISASGPKITGRPRSILLRGKNLKRGEKEKKDYEHKLKIDITKERGRRSWALCRWIRWPKSIC